MENKSREFVFAIDLLWCRVGKVGGSESFIRNLMTGMQQTNETFIAYLIVADDNKRSFEPLLSDRRFRLLICEIASEDVVGRVIFQNLKLTNILIKNEISVCLEPIFSIPWIGARKVKYYAVIHDIQARHFPEYFSLFKRIYLYVSWKHTIRNSQKTITISNYAKEDIIKSLKVKVDRLTMIYNPIFLNKLTDERAIEIVSQFGLKQDEFFFCVSSAMPHKNVEVLLEVMKGRADDFKLVICGVGGDMTNKFIRKIDEWKIKDKVLLIPFVSDEIRDALYQMCRLFLFPSLFEGFGMPPVEAMLMDKTVITTYCTGIPEVTCNEAIYVNDPRCAAEWNTKINYALADDCKPAQRKISSVNNPYNATIIAEKYLSVMKEG